MAPHLPAGPVLASGLLGPLALLALAGAAVAVFSRRALLLYRLARLGRPARRFDRLPARLEEELVVVLGQRKLLQRLGPGLMHAFIFWGFLVLLTTIAEAVGEVFRPDFAIPLVGRTGWLGLLQDLFAVLVVAGVEMAVFFRKVRRPERFKGSHLEEADFILLMILGVVFTLLALNGARIALGLNDSPREWTPVSWLVSLAFRPMDPGAVGAFERAFLWAHLAIIFGFLAYIPYSKHLHIFVSELNVFFTKARPRGTLEPLHLDLERAGEEVRLGVGTVEDLTWKQVLDLYSCTECGRCQQVCPAWNTGKPLSPKLLVMNLRDHLLEVGPEILEARRRGREVERVPLNPDVVEDEVVWDCVTCGACVQECPVNIEHIDHIVDMRRHLVMAESRFPQEATALLRNLETSHNPWGADQSQRAEWARGLGVRVLEDGRAPEYLYWVGCAASFDDRAKGVARALAALLQRAAVPFAILGPRELCTGDPARRFGHEYLYQELARRNVETLRAVGARKVLVNCPHCFNTLRNEYPDFGGRYEVVHHTQLLAQLLREGRLQLTREVRELLTYHDPCYLGRHNGVYDEPRDVLERVPGLSTTELPRHRERAFCCGAGGSRMWMEEHVGKRINVERTEEAISTGATALGVACPFCLIMLDDGAKAKGEAIRVVDVAQVVVAAAGPRPSPSPAEVEAVGGPTREGWGRP
ncbi:MAG TPA: heterodisulfide reductase-related iron-sulfur binding cluster [Actinomycetota bacterium]|nr:heterodisulfide reductase-related iron-sulfur binding cluster [Actinomycetota bacterium]